MLLIFQPNGTSFWDAVCNAAQPQKLHRPAHTGERRKGTTERGCWGEKTRKNYTDWTNLLWCLSIITGTFKWFLIMLKLKPNWLAQSCNPEAVSLSPVCTREGIRHEMTKSFMQVGLLWGILQKSAAERETTTYNIHFYCPLPTVSKIS